MIPENFRKRLHILAKLLDITQADIYKKLGSNSTTVSNAFSGKHLPRLDFLLSFLRAYPEVNGDWLLTGRGEMFFKETSQVNEPVPEYGLTVEQRLTYIENYLKQRDEYFKP